MYYFTKWDVLIVDDEPDVLALSKLTMEAFEVYGLPLKLHTVQTKTQAIELLLNEPDLAINLALAFVDVVMETDKAGLELCDHIREEIGNRLTQIFIRTGQSGLAPEKAVIDQYEINGYFTKIEATEEKLYSLVKSGIRQFLWSHMAQLYMAGLNEVLRVTQWQQKIEQMLVSFIESAPGVSADVPLYVAFDDKVLTQHGLEEHQIMHWRQKLDQVEGLRFSLNGNTYLRAEDSLWGIRIVASPNNSEVILLCQTPFAPPEDLVTMTHDFFQGLATLWKHSLPHSN
ncbi:response regulator receiver protein [Chloroflexi bacterium TSY]|nr:response regulator receiver protein [Chloroflexi bacterium TSY]